MSQKNQLNELTNQEVRTEGLKILYPELLNRGWKISLATKNEKGIHMWIENNDASIKYSILFSGMTKIKNMSFGSNIPVTKFTIISTNIDKSEQDFYIIPNQEIKHLIRPYPPNEKAEYFLWIRDYIEFKNQWRLLVK